jgi:hypothetical protein
MHCRVAKLQAVLIGKPLLNFNVATESLRLGEAFFQGLHYVGGDRLLAGIRPRLSDFSKPVETALFIELKPVGNGVAMYSQVAACSGPAFDLSSLHEKQHMVAALDLGISLLANQTFELLGRLRDLREVVHGRRRCWEEAYRPSQIDNTA